MPEKISVIVPVYNVEQDLPRCLDSILEQTFRDLEIIAVDDGSTDGSSLILDHYSQIYPQVKAIHQKNSGVTSARLHGVSKATGEWIGFVDSDDYIEPQMYQILFNNAKKYDASISHCGYQMIFSDGRIHFFHNTGRIVLQDKLTGLQDLLDGTLVEPGLWNKLYHKSLFEDLLRKDEMDMTIKINEDLLMNVLLFGKAEKSVFYDVCPYHYVVRAMSATRNNLNSAQIFDPIKVRAEIINLVPPELHNTAKKKYVNACLNACNSILIAGKAAHENEFQTTCALLNAQKDNFFLMGRTRMWMAIALLQFPRLYQRMYLFYNHYLRKRVYD